MRHDTPSSIAAASVVTEDFSRLTNLSGREQWEENSDARAAEYQKIAGTLFEISMTSDSMARDQIDELVRNELEARNLDDEQVVRLSHEGIMRQYDHLTHQQMRGQPVVTASDNGIQVYEYDEDQAEITSRHVQQALDDILQQK